MDGERQKCSLPILIRSDFHRNQLPNRWKIVSIREWQIASSHAKLSDRNLCSFFWNYKIFVSSRRKKLFYDKRILNVSRASIPFRHDDAALISISQPSRSRKSTTTALEEVYPLSRKRATSPPHTYSSSVPVRVTRDNTLVDHRMLIPKRFKYTFWKVRKPHILIKNCLSHSSSLGGFWGSFYFASVFTSSPHQFIAFRC